MSAEDMLSGDIVYKHGGVIPVSAELLDDTASMRSAIDQVWRRYTHPWEFPDRNPMPRFTPFPRIARLLGRIEGARLRAEDIVHAARYGLPTVDEN